MLKEQAAFEIFKLGLASAIFFGVLIFFSRIKEKIGSGVDQEAYDYAVAHAKSFFWWVLALFTFIAVVMYLFGNDVF